MSSKRTAAIASFALLAAAFAARLALAVVVNVSPDGSMLDITEPWTITGARFCPPGSLGLHAFRQGETEINICFMGESGKSAGELLKGLWEKYKQRFGKKFGAGPYPGEARPLKGGITIHHFTLNVPPGFIMDGHAALMDAYFKRGPKLYMYIAVKPVKAGNMQDLRPELEAFEKTAKDGFRVLEAVKWATRSAKKK